MYVIVWEYKINTARRQEFINYYNPVGDWAKFFRQAPDYITTEFFKSEKSEDVYITIDKWLNRESYELFTKTYQDVYEKMDRHCEQFTREEKLIGKYTSP